MIDKNGKKCVVVGVVLLFIICMCLFKLNNLISLKELCYLCLIYLPITLLVIIRLVKDKFFRDKIYLNKMDGKHYLIVILTTISIICMSVCSFIILAISRLPISNSYSYDESLIYAVITGIIIAPFLEEIFFRGIVLRKLENFGIPIAVILSSLLFALLHGISIGLIYKFVFGIVLAILIYKTKTIMSSIVCHMLNNTIAIFISDQLPDTTIGYFRTTYGLIKIVVLMCIFLVVLIFILSPKFYKENNTASL